MDISLKFESLISKKVLSYEIIKDGITNDNYLIKTNDGLYVFRISKANPLTLYKDNEKKIIESLKEINYPFYNKSYQISEYFVHEDINHLNYLKQIVDKVKYIHSLDIDVSSFDCFALLNEYKEKSHSKPFANEEIVIEKVKKLYNKYPLVLCHNDLLFANILINKDEVKIIDYEYGGKNIALFDLASLISENNIDDVATQRKILNFYYGNDDNYDDLNTLLVFLDLLWGYWAKAMYNLYKDEIYLKIADIKEKRYDIKNRTL